MSASSPTLLELSLRSLASKPRALTRKHIDRLSADLAQLLFETLIENGSLDMALLRLFEGVSLWRVQLRAHPGLHTGWLHTLQGGKLTHLDISHSRVTLVSL